MRFVCKGNHLSNMPLKPYRLLTSFTLAVGLLFLVGHPRSAIAKKATKSPPKKRSKATPSKSAKPRKAPKAKARKIPPKKTKPSKAAKITFKQTLHSGEGGYIRPLGWTQDNRYLLWETYDTAGTEKWYCYVPSDDKDWTPRDGENGDYIFFTLRLVVVLDTKTMKKRTYFRALKTPETTCKKYKAWLKKALPKQKKTYLSKKQLLAWYKKHRALSLRSLQAPDGSSSIQLLPMAAAKLIKHRGAFLYKFSLELDQEPLSFELLSNVVYRRFRQQDQSFLHL